jgi:hypothetical protein
MNLPDAFYTSRVTEALDSLAIHVTSARNIAASLKPIKTAGLNLTEEEEARPIITSISPRTTDPLGTVEFKMKGKNLTADSITGFELFLEDDPNISFPESSPADVEPIYENNIVTGFKGSLDLRGANSGSYEVRITDENSTPHLPGLIVEVEADESAERTSKTSPKITKTQAKREGNWLNLKVEATGTDPLSYQWLRDGNPIRGGTKKNVRVSAKPLDASYSVVVANTAGFVVSEVMKMRGLRNGE